MKKNSIFLILIVISFVFLCGCTTQSNSSSSVVTVAPIQKTQFSINEPATDGNLRITLLGTRESFERSNTKTFTVSLKLENLKSDKTIQMLAGDFQLLDDNNNLISPAHQLNSYSAKYDLRPGQREQIDLDFFIYPDQKGSKIKYDFSGSSGISGPIVIFNL